MTRYYDDLVWLAPAVAAGCVVYLVYLLTNAYPAHGAGLYFTMAEEVVEHGYALPRTVPYYTEGGIPFAYPPLAIYAIALVREATGIGPLALSRWVPGLVVLVSLVPTYFLARELLESRLGAAIASTLVAANPQLIDWHLTAGGLVRAPAFLFVLVGLYAGVRRYHSGERRWVVLSTVCFGLTVLTHPTYALFFGVGYLVLFAGLDRTPTGFVDGAIVAVGGVGIAAPWWMTVVSTHGVDVFLRAMGTHGGIGGGAVARLATTPLEPLVVLLAVVLALGLLAGLVSGRWLLVGWLVVVGLVLSQPRFTLFVGTFLLVAVVLDVGSRLRRRERARLRRGGPALVFAFAVGLSLLAGAAYVRDDTATPRPSVTPNHVDETDLEAMEWARTSTPADASFVVLGDAAEWFPLFAHRTVLVSPWGAEWEGPRAYARHMEVFRAASFCNTGDCLSGALDRHGVRPDYVYVPKKPYPVQGTPHPQTAALSERMERSERYELVFENRGVAIFRVAPVDAETGQ